MGSVSRLVEEVLTVSLLLTLSGSEGDSECHWRQGKRVSQGQWRVLNLMRNCNHIPQFIEVAEGTTVGPEAIEPVTSHYMATVY